MTSLADLQSQFQSFLLQGDRSIERLTAGSARLPARERLAVYGDAYRLRLLEVLDDDFPGLRSLVGESQFEELGGAYLDACPSAHPSVRWFGRRLPQFLRDAGPWRDQPLLAEMADFEWAQGEVMDAADSPLAGEDDLAALTPDAWPGMRITFQAALRRLDLAWNAPVIWQAIDRGDDKPPPPVISQPPTAWLLWRKNLEVHWRSLDASERYALDAAREGCPFGEICEGLLERTNDEQVPLLAAGYLKRWLGDGVVSGVEG